MPCNKPDFLALTADIKLWAGELGFQQTGITDTDLSPAEQYLSHWLNDGCHGEMEYMARHGNKRSRPAELEPGTRSIISVRLNYLPVDASASNDLLNEPVRAFVSRYALGRDYHKMMRNRLQRLAKRIEQAIGPFAYRAFVDSAPVMEKPIAEKAGLGWIGKHSNLINRRAGSWFFLGELYTNLPLAPDIPSGNHCGTCNACIEVCPTRAITAPYRVDARRCISYLTIELHGAIPEQLRPLMGNRIYGCDDCQLVCPWNRFAVPSRESDFAPRHGLDSASLIELFRWSEEEFLHKLQGSPIRRIGHDRWLRNIAVALGNAPHSVAICRELEKRRRHGSTLVNEHIEWALTQQANKQ